MPLLFSGCANWSLFKAKEDLAATRVEVAKVMGAIDERDRQMVTAIKESLEKVDIVSLPNEAQGRVAVARDLSVETERLNGIPIEKIDIQALYDKWYIENRPEYTQNLFILKQDNTDLLKNKHKLEIREQGQIAGVKILEDKKAASGGFMGWVKGLGITTIIIIVLGFVVLGPAFIPILGNIVGWIVKKIPQLIGLFRIVSVDIMDQVVDNVQTARDDFNSNADKNYTGKEVKTILDKHLSNKQTIDTDRVIEQRKLAIHSKKQK